MDKQSETRLAYDFVTLVRQHQAGLWRYVRALGADTSTSDDIVQETFLTLLEKPFEYRGPAATDSYLRTVARNRYISLCRKTGRQVLMDEFEQLESDWQDLVKDTDGEELLWALRGCFSKLTPRARQALTLRYRENCSREDIAAALNMAENGIKTLLRRSRDKLRDCLEKKATTWEPDDE